MKKEDLDKVYDDTYVAPRTEGGRFMKGASGNPGGRPKKAEEVRELAKNVSMKAMQTVIKIMNDEDQKTADRLAAARVVLSAGGVMIQQTKAVQDAKDKEDPMAEISAEELKKFLAKASEKPS